MTDDAIPAGMVAWAGGDAAPADWDGGPVLRRHGGMSLPNGQFAWSSNGGGQGNIIAYTTAASSDERDGAREALITIDRVANRLANAGQPHSSNDLRAAAKILESALAASRPTDAGAGEPLRIDWNKHHLAEAYDLVEGVRRAAAQDSESPLDTSLRAALDAIEAADCEWDGITLA